MWSPPLNADGSLREPLAPGDAKKLALHILSFGVTDKELPHFQEEIQKDDLREGDVLNALKAGWMNPRYPPEIQSQRWRYRIGTQRITVVVEFESPEEMVLVTAWRNR